MGAVALTPAQRSVLAWRDDLAALDPAGQVPTALSAAGLRAAWAAALGALDTAALRRAWALPGHPWPRATLVVARTVVTAPLEWCAVLLGRGTAVRMKVPEEAPEVGELLAARAARHGLPLTVTTKRSDVVAPTGAPHLVVAMGNDGTIDAVRAGLPAEATLLGFGHRYSVAWASDESDVRALAEQIALHDTRGCRSPVAVFSDHPRADGLLAEAMAAAQARWPLGGRTDFEAAKLRVRTALARVLGTVHGGGEWWVLGLPAARFLPEALPRVAVLHPGGPDTLARAVASTRDHLSVVGVPHALVASPPPSLRALGEHLVPIEAMQRPPLERRHDGVDWLRATLRAGPPTAR